MPTHRPNEITLSSTLERTVSYSNSDTHRPVDIMIRTFLKGIYKHFDILHPPEGGGIQRHRTAGLGY